MHIGLMLHLTPQPGQTATETYRAFTTLVRQADALGIEEAWVTEHHFNPHSLCPAPHLLMAHFLAVTTHLRLGSAATLIGFHDPIKVAEELATLSALAPGRVMVGFAKGGPFEAQKQVFAIDGDLSRARMLEAVPAIKRLMGESPGAHKGEHYQWAALDLQPKCDDIPSFLATADAQGIAMAARHGHGLMSAQFWPAEKIEANRDAYIEAHPDGALPDLMVARGLFIDDDGDLAREKALRHIHDFRAWKSQLWGHKKGPMAGVDDETLLSRMLVGTPGEVLASSIKMARIGVHRLALNPLTWDGEERLRLVSRYMREVWPEVRMHRTHCCPRAALDY